MRKGSSSFAAARTAGNISVVDELGLHMTAVGASGMTAVAAVAAGAGGVRAFAAGAGSMTAIAAVSSREQRAFEGNQSSRSQSCRRRMAFGEHRACPSWQKQLQRGGHKRKFSYFLTFILRF